MIEKNKLKVCPICNEKFNKILDVKNHLILNCISIDLENNSNTEESNTKELNTKESNNPIINLTNSSTININNNSIVNEINGNNNIINNIHLYNPISFDDDWDISHLSNEDKNLLIVSMVKYTKTLEYLLKNKSNHNVLIDKESNSGLVYKNNNIEKMTIEEICDKSFDKIYDHLNSFYDNSKNINVGCVDPEYIHNQRKSMKIKYFHYKDDEK